jgi:hypothetical protein
MLTRFIQAATLSALIWSQEWIEKNLNAMYAEEIYSDGLFVLAKIAYSARDEKKQY